MLTTAGMTRSNMGAKEGSGWFSVKEGKPIARLNGLKHRKIDIKINIFKCLTNFSEVIAIPRINKRG